MTIQFDEEKQNKRVTELKEREEEELAQMLAPKYNVGYIDLSIIPIKPDALRIIKEEEAREAKMAVFDIVDKKIKVAVISPSFKKAEEVIKNLEEKGYIISVFMVSSRSLERAWEKYKDISFATLTESGTINISNEDIDKLLAEISNLSHVQKLIEETIISKETYRISRLLEIILGGALSTNSSDIHIEPEEEKARIRYRLDGILIDVSFLSKKDYELMSSRLKLISGLKLNIKNEAQDGRFSIKVRGIEIEIRASTLPGTYGESIVLRILNPETISVPMEELGIEPHLMEILEKEIRKPNGLILNTGPTGSGKTSTLYAFLKKIHKPEIKIITIEDPVEYHLPGITQTQTDHAKNYTFAQGLRASLRQDPDVIMVGEIRDAETADIAIQASLTGHLVFSTLHTNNAAGTFPRLIDLDINPKIISSALSIVMAQRLVRKLCPFCKKKVTTKEADKVILDKIFNTIKNKESYTVNTEKIWESVGCEKCNNTGYKGRVGIFEAIIADENIEKVLTTNPSEREIKKIAQDQGILNLGQDGVIKILQGITSLDEVNRVIDLGEEI